MDITLASGSAAKFKGVGVIVGALRRLATAGLPWGL